jgi:histidine triad (HIT) family protein
MSADSARTAQDCAFCRVGRGDDTSVQPVCEGSTWVAFFPIEPATPGHTLVIPREHVPDFWRLPLPLASDLSAAAIRVGNAIVRALSPAGMNLITSSGEAAEQTVFHVHLHIVPRWTDDGFGRIWPPERAMNPAIKEDYAERVRRECGHG